MIELVSCSDCLTLLNSLLMATCCRSSGDGIITGNGVAARDDAPIVKFTVLSLSFDLAADRSLLALKLCVIRGRGSVGDIGIV